MREIPSPTVLEWQESDHERINLPYWESTNGGQYYIFRAANIYVAGKRAYGREQDFDEIFTWLQDAMDYCQEYESAKVVIVAD